MRAIAALVAVALVAVISVDLLRAKATWAAPLAVLLVGAAVVVTGLVLRNWASAPRKRRRPLPSDPGWPRAPQGAPYRGPH